MSVNKVILVGRLGQDPEVKTIPSGMSVANFSIATNEVWTDKSGQKQERTEWHRLVVWGRQAELCQQYLSKGRQIYAEGKLQTRQWQDQAGQTRYTTEVRVQTLQFLGGNNASAGNNMPADDAYASSFGQQNAGGASFSQNNNFGSSSTSFTPSAPSAPESVMAFAEEDVPF